MLGINASIAAAAVRPGEMLKVTHTAAVRDAIRDVLRSANARTVPTSEISDDALSRMVESTHHEGVCVTMRPRALLEMSALITRLRRPEARGVLALDHVANPHNLGAIVRSAAYFGIDAVLMRSESGRSPLTPAAVRIAEGGAEHVGIVVVPDLAVALNELRKHRIAVVGADAHARESLFARPLESPCVLVMGSEHAGLTEAVHRACDRFVAIPGAGRVESLNVSVAAGVLLAEMARGR